MTDRLFLGCIRRYVVTFVVVFAIRYGLLLSKLRQFGLIYYTSLDSKHTEQVKLLSARFNQTINALKQLGK